MTDDSSGRLTRRTALKGLGGAAATVGVAGLGLLATSGPAAAANFDIGDPVTIVSDDGTVDYVAIYGDSVVRWDGFDTEARAFDITITATVTPDDGGNSIVTDHQLHATNRVDLTNTDWGNYDESLSGPGTSGTIKSGIGLHDSGTHNASIDWHIVTADGSTPSEYGLPPTPIDGSQLTVGPGEDETADTTNSYTITMDSTYAWYDSVEGGSELYSETFSSDIPVDVTNKGEDASATDGGGDDGAVGGPTPTPTPTPSS